MKRCTQSLPLALSLACLVSCAREGPAPLADRSANTAESDPTSTQRTPGLSITWWVVDDTDSAVVRTLSPHTDPPLPADPALRDRWRTSGLRLVRVPEAQLDVISAALPPASERYTLAAGWNAQWSEIFRARRLPAGRLQLAGRWEQFPAGFLRLLARCWATPGTRALDEPIVRLDLTFQVLPPRRNEDNDPFSDPKIEAEESRGRMLHELEALLRPQRGFAYILTSESPDTPWNSEPRGTATPDTGFSPPDDPDQPSSNPPAPRRTSTNPLDVLVARPPTIGEAGFGVEPRDTSPRKMKAIVILRIEHPDRVTLLP